MAEQRRFGPTLGAGVTVIERPAEKPIEPAALGVTCYAGILEKGAVGELIHCPTKKSLIKKTGGLIPESLLPDCAQDFFDAGQGAGALYLVRVTDGSEVVASITLTARRHPYTPVVQVDAKNGGRWAGRKQVVLSDLSNLAETTVDIAADGILENQWKGASLQLADVPGKSYTIVGNTASVVSVVTVTVSADSTMLADYVAASGASDEIRVVLTNPTGKQLTMIVKNGIQQPDTEWGLVVYVNGELRLVYEDLSSDPSASNYFVNVINDDQGNDDIKVTDLWTGAASSEIRPANYYNVSATAGLTATTLKSEILHAKGPSDGTRPDKGNAGTFTYGADVIPCSLVLECTDATTPGSEVWSVTPSVLGAGLLNVTLPDATTGVAYLPGYDWLPGFTIAAGTANFAVGDFIHVYCQPFKTDELVGGIMTPNTAKRRIIFKIVSNTHDTITIGAGNDMTLEAAAEDPFTIQYPQGMSGGYDGLAGVSDTDYTPVFDVESSPINSLFGKNQGLVKLAVPGIYSAVVQKAGLEYASAKNYQFRVEIDPTIIDEQDAEEFINDTIGRNDMGVVAFPSYGYIDNPEAAGQKLIPLTGAIHGREALTAKNWDGYHKAAAGVDVNLPKVLRLPTGEKILDEEFLNPHGIQIIKFKEGNAIIWGDRTIAVDSAWKWKHQREQMSYYENVMREEFDWVVFAINNSDIQQTALSALRGFYLPEYSKGALRGDNFQDACEIKLDDEINTNATAAAGDLLAEITLRLADTVERFIITVSKAGIFEAVV
jgi:hypothetical protein